MNNTTILNLINKTIQKVSTEFDVEINSNKEKIYLYTEKGTFDSMMLVVLLAEIEEALLINFSVEISLTSDRAMSKSSPFESNLSILDLILEIIS
jgi:acyl carrier protein